MTNKQRIDEFEKELIADKQLIEIGTKLDGLEKDVLVAYKLKQQRLDIVEFIENECGYIEHGKYIDKAELMQKIKDME